MTPRSYRSPGSPAGASVEMLESRRLLASTIGGMAFNDADADGLRDSGEAGLPNVRVYLDLNYDGKFQGTEPSQLTNSGGEYTFTNLAAGVYRVRQITNTGYRQTSPARGYHDIAANGADIHVANDLGSTTTAIVRGTVYRDDDGDGAKDLAEQGMAGVRVYIDANNNGKRDSGERSRLTNASGDYRFACLAPGTYVIRIVKPAGLSITAPAPGHWRVKLKAAQSLSNRHFGLEQPD